MSLLLTLTISYPLWPHQNDGRYILVLESLGVDIHTRIETRNKLIHTAIRGGIDTFSDYTYSEFAQEKMHKNDYFLRYNYKNNFNIGAILI